MNWVYIVSGVIIVIGIILFFYYARKTKYKTYTRPQQYEKIREKLTTREPEPEEEESEEESGGIGLNLSSIVMGFIVLMIMIAIGGVILGQLDSTFSQDSPAANVSSSVIMTFSTISSIMPIFGVITAILIIGVVISVLIRPSSPL